MTKAEYHSFVRRWMGFALASLVAVGASAQGGDWTAPENVDHAVLRVGGTTRRLFSNLRYESNNRAMRGAFDARPEAGYDNARRQRAIAARTRGLFVLRDALFSQPDHPVEHQACAIMMPANWVTAAVADTMAGEALRPVSAPAMRADRAWARLRTQAQMFGSFQPSQRLFETARRPLREGDADAQAQTRNARFNVRALAAEAQHLIDAAPRGARAVADAGAERIAASDRAYFTDELRRERVIVLAVEHPSEHELRDENKGLAIWGREVPDAALEMTRNCVLSRRLRDGPLALERYDLTIDADRRRLIGVLEALVPPGSEGHPIWVWVGGGLIEGSELVRDASDRLPQLERELSRANIERSRVIVYNRPSFRLRGHQAELQPRLRRFRRADRFLSINASPGAFRRALDL